MTMNDVAFNVPSIEEFMKSPLAKLITFSANDYGYNGNTKNLIVKWVHPIFLKAMTTVSKEANMKWWDAMDALFAD